MKRTYADFVGEYYDQSEDVYDQLNALGVRSTDAKRVLNAKQTRFSRKAQREKFLS
jgi:hypothetical protein